MLISMGHAFIDSSVTDILETPRNTVVLGY